MHNDNTTTTIAPLKDLPDYEMAEGNPDVRGWDVSGDDGQKFGEVNDVLVDQQAERVKYLDVEVDKEVASSKDQHVLIPIGAAQLDESDDRVIVNGVSSTQVRNLLAYQRQAVTREYEDQVQQAFSRDPNLAVTEVEWRVGRR